MKKIWLKMALSGVVLGLLIVVSMIFFVVSSDENIKNSALGIMDTLLRDSFDLQIEDQVKTAVTMMDSLETLVDQGVLTKEQARLVAYHMVREARYGQSGYFWGDDPDGTNRILYGREDVENKNRLDLKDVNGYELIKNIIKAGTSGGGFTDFWFPKEGKAEAQPKRGYSLQSEYFGIVVGTGNYVDDIDETVGLYESELEKIIGQTITRMLMTVFILLLCVFLFSAFMGKLLSRPIKETTETLEDISSGEGDLTREMEARGSEEVRRMARAFNAFTGKLAGIVRSVLTALNSARSNSENLVSTSEETTASVRQIGKNSDTILGLTNNLNEQIGQVNNSFESLGEGIQSLDSQIENQVSAVEESTASIVQMTASINSVAARARDKRKSVTILLDTTAKGIHEIDEAKKSVDLMTDSIQEIMDITGLINDIADQTNLLSMNASIEAAHAGDAGKGFGVVAGEIRKLAESSSANASSIELTLKKNVELIKQMETSTDNSTVIFRSVNTIARETDEVFAEITRAMEELSVGAREINTSVNALQDISTGVRNNSQNMNSRLDELNKTSSVMGDVAENTLLAVEEIQQGIGQISAAMENLNDAVGHIVNDVKEVEDQMGGFKV